MNQGVVESKETHKSSTFLRLRSKEQASKEDVSSFSLYNGIHNAYFIAVPKGLFNEQYLLYTKKINSLFTTRQNSSWF